MHRIYYIKILTFIQKCKIFETMDQGKRELILITTALLLTRTVGSLDSKENIENLFANYANFQMASMSNLPRTCDDLNWGSVFTDEAIIQKIEDMIPEFDMKGLEPAIPIQDLERYQQLPLADCVMQDGEFKFQVEVPAKSKNQDFQLYNFPKGSFSFEIENGICSFEYPTKGIVETSSGSSIFPLTEEQWSRCIETNICQIPSSLDVNYGDYICLKAMFGGKSGKELAPYCKFHCQPYPTPLPSVQNSRKEISESYFFSWILK